METGLETENPFKVFISFKDIILDKFRLDHDHKQTIQKSNIKTNKEINPKFGYLISDKKN